MLAPSRPTTAPMKKVVTATIGMASRPARSARLTKGAARKRPRVEHQPADGHHQPAVEGQGLVDLEPDIDDAAAQTVQQLEERAAA